LKWRDTDLSAEFKAFDREVRAKATTLVQLLHHKKEILDIILKHLRIEGNQSRVAILEYGNCSSLAMRLVCSRIAV